MSEIEKGLISAIISKPDKLIDIGGIVCQEYLEDWKCRDIFVAILSLWHSQEKIDVLKVYSLVKSKIELPWLLDIASMAPCDHIWTAKQIAERAKRKRIITAVQDVLAKKNDSEYILDGLLDIYNQEIIGPEKSGAIRESLAHFDKVQSRNKQRGSFGIRTEFNELERNMIQFCEGHIWVIGGYTSTGKTAIAIEIMGRLNCKVMMISTEQTTEQLVARMLANKVKISHNVILSGGMISKHADMVNNEREILEQRQIIIRDDVYELSEIERVIIKASLQGGVDVVFVDYLQNIRVAGAKSEYDAMNQIAKGLQRLAKRAKCCIVCFSQIPNSAAKEDSGILEFKGAGEIAAVADIGVWVKRSKDSKRRILFDVRKNRHGALCQMVLEFGESWACLDEV